MPHVLKFSRNGSLLLAGGGRGGKSGRVVVWSVTTGERVIEVGDETDAVLAADISPDQTQIALGGPSKVVRVYSTRTASCIHEIRKHTDWITALEFSPDGVLLATGDRNGGLFVWEAFTGREYFTLRGHTAAITELSWRLDGNVLRLGQRGRRRCGCGRWRTATRSSRGAPTAAAWSRCGTPTTAGSSRRPRQARQAVGRRRQPGADASKRCPTWPCAPRSPTTAPA